MERAFRANRRKRAKASSGRREGSSQPAGTADVSTRHPRKAEPMAEQKPYDYESGRDAPGPRLTPEEARQGVISGRVFLILTVSLVLALIAAVILYSGGIV